MPSWIYILVVVLLIGLVVGYWKREWVGQKLASLKREPSAEKLAEMQRAKEERERQRREALLHPSRWTLFWRRMGVVGANVVISIGIGLLAAIIAGAAVYLFVDKTILITGGFAGVLFVFGGGITWVVRTN